MTTTRDQLARWALFASLATGSARPARHGHARRIRALRVANWLYRGDPSIRVHGLVTGLMQLSLANAKGTAKVVELIGPGETLGEAVVFLRRPFPVDAFAVADTDLLLLVGGDALNRLLDTEPGSPGRCSPRWPVACTP